ncbi:MAG TPA: hypothetical protein VFD07_03160 [Candidatus Krumholzibacteria bacterium]|nr:hypothetical protein [Candidatus Krumholzibacteria bacterium]
MDRHTLSHEGGKTRARSLALCLWLMVLACDDQSTAPTGPTAAFTVTPRVGWTTTEFLFDASTSSDPNHAVSKLEVRWDWESDGVWDTPWTTDKAATHRYTLTRSGTVLSVSEGWPIIRLEVRDPSEQTDETARTVDVALLNSEEAVVNAVARAYLSRDANFLASILAADAGRNAEFRFILSEPTDLGETYWGYGEEVRIHQRMFHPEALPAGDPPVPADLWLNNVAVAPTPLEVFSERVDLYSDNGGLDGKLDPAIWRATDALYATWVFFDMVGTDYLVEGFANFVVLEDLTKNMGDAGKFLIYIWEDISGFLQQPGIAVAATSWSRVKRLYK